MILWVALALLAALTAAAVALPLLRGGRSGEAARPGAVYRAQLEEIEREREAGLLAPEAADEARREIARRLLAAEDQAGKRAPAAVQDRPSAGAAAIAGVLVAGLATGLYLIFGAPEQPGRPLDSRDLLAEAEAKDCEAREAFFRLRLMPDPTRSETWIRERPPEWSAFADAAACAGDFPVAFAAARMAVELKGGAATAEDRIAVALAAASLEEGRLSDATRATLADASAADPANAWARFFDAYEIERGGNAEGARAAFFAILQEPARAAREAFVSRALRAAVDSGSCAMRATFYQLYLLPDPQRPESWKGDAPGWTQFGRGNLCLGRFDLAAIAFRAVLRLAGADAAAENFVDLGVAATEAAGGEVTEEARAAFREALARDARNVPARVYLATARLQSGDAAGAAGELEAIMAELPADSSWRAVVESRLAEARAAPQGPAPADIAGDPQIRGMVDGLAARLEAEPNDLDGWLLLMTSYVRLGEADNARAAAAKARETFKDDEAALARIEAKAKELGLA